MNAKPGREDSEQTLCCVVTLVCLGVSGLAPAAGSAIVGAVECTMTLSAAPIPGITELGFDVTDSITVLSFETSGKTIYLGLEVCSRLLPVLLFF